MSPALSTASRVAFWSAVVLLWCVSAFIYFDARGWSPFGHVAALPVPGPVVIVERQTFRDRIPGVFTPDQLGLPHTLHRKARPNHARGLHKYDAEAAAYAKAYANAKYANELLGEQRYQEHA